VSELHTPIKISKPNRFQIFHHWLKTNRSRFVYQPYVTGGKIVRSGRRCREIEFHMEGIVDGLTFKFSNWGIDIFFYADGEEWDRIWAFHLDNDRQWRRDDGSMERFWIDGCLEPFLIWCNTTLIFCSHLELFEMKHRDLKAVQLSGRVPEDREWKPLRTRFEPLLNLSEEQYRDFFIPIRKE
jgi:hypothetical protein